jgi:cytochrome c-type protein NapC
MRLTLLASGMAFGLAMPAAQAAAPDWGGVPGKEVWLFYPGQASWEWALTPSDMSGADDFKKGKNCDVCHIGEEKDMGAHIVTGKPRSFKTGEKPSIEPTPIAGKPGAFPATVKVANDGTNLYVHVEFNPGAQPDARNDTADARVTVMFNNGKVPEANRGGCFAACHDDSAGMASAGGSNRTMYLSKTRAKLTRQGGGDAMKSADELTKLKADGYQLEFWVASLNPGQPAKTETQLVFDKREASSPNIVTADAKQAGGGWSVTIARPLAAPAPYTAIAPGATYRISLAIHAGHAGHRFHYVAEERSLSLDSAGADLVAAKK